MAKQESNQHRTEPDDEPVAPAGAEDIEINAEDAETVAGGQTSAFMWVGSRTDGRS